METENDYLNYGTSYKELYLKNNIMLKHGASVDEVYECISVDVDFVLESLYITPNKLGYGYWKDAVFIYILSGKHHMSICNEIYPLVAQKHAKTPMSVERAMRLCFEDALYYISKNSENYVTRYFKNYLLHPHNGEIMIKLVEIISSSEFQKMKQKL